MRERRHRQRCSRFFGVSTMQFTNGWFEEEARANWDRLLPSIRPKKILEIGSFEGQSTCYMIQMLGCLYPFELHCVDSWDGVGNYKRDMNEIKRIFFANTREAGEIAPYLVSLFVHEEKSASALPKMFTTHEGSFDFIYIDGSHNGGDVIIDAVNSFNLAKTGGVIGFDDYLWHDMSDPTLGRPGPAIDLFLEAFADKLKRLPSSRGQVYVEKTAS
jgi:predicted O-methyltransferase YrrM